MFLILIFLNRAVLQIAINFGNLDMVQYLLSLPGIEINNVVILI